MPWVRFDDQYPIHRKVAALSDAAYRLHSASIPWSNRNLMDGWIPAEDLDQVCAQVRKSATFVLELVRRGLFHEAGFVCDSEECPADGSQTDGWVIHDYWDYQPSKKKVKAERAKNAERQQRFRERRASKPGKDQSNGVTNGVTNGDITTPRPGPTHTSPNGEVEADGKPPPPHELKPPTDQPIDGMPEVPNEGETPNQRLHRLTKIYTDAEPLSSWHPCREVIKKAVDAGIDDETIVTALKQLLEGNWPLSVNTLRVAVRGPGRTNTVAVRDDQSNDRQDMFTRAMQRAIERDQEAGRA